MVLLSKASLPVSCPLQLGPAEAVESHTYVYMYVCMYVCIDVCIHAGRGGKTSSVAEHNWAWHGALDKSCPKLHREA